MRCPKYTNVSIGCNLDTVESVIMLPSIPHTDPNIPGLPICFHAEKLIFEKAHNPIFNVYSFHSLLEVCL